MFHLGKFKINTVCLPLRFERDETFESFTATVSGFGNHFMNGSMLPLSPEGIFDMVAFHSI